MRVGVMFYHRTNRDQIGPRNTAGADDAPTRRSRSPCRTARRHGRQPEADDGDGLQPAAGVQRRCRTTSVDNEPYLDTDYNGVEFTASKRFSKRWQMVAGLTVGKNTGGVSRSGTDLNDPNVTFYPNGHHRQRLAGRVPAVGQLPCCRRRSALAGALIANSGYPYSPTYSVTRAAAALQGVTLTRASQTVFLSDRGDERLAERDDGRPAHLARLPLRHPPDRAAARLLQHRQRGARS